MLGLTLTSYLLPNGRKHIPYGTGLSRFNRDPYFEDWATLCKLLRERKIQPVIGAGFPILEAARANALLESGTVIGNVVLLAPELMKAEIPSQEVHIMKIRNAIRITSTALGMYAGLLGAEHGVLELLQGSIATHGPVIQAMGPSCTADAIWHACFPAFTILPSYTASGVLATLFGLSVFAWAATCIQLKRGGLVLLLLSIGMFLTGGGFVPLLTGMLAAAAASTFRLAVPRPMAHNAPKAAAPPGCPISLDAAVNRRVDPFELADGASLSRNHARHRHPALLIVRPASAPCLRFCAFAHDMTPEPVKST